MSDSFKVDLHLQHGSHGHQSGADESMRTRHSHGVTAVDGDEIVATAHRIELGGQYILDNEPPP